MSENNKYQKGAKICEDLFRKTGEIKYHNMMTGFKNLEKENNMQNENNQMGM